VGYQRTALNCSGNQFTGIDMGKQIPGNQLVVRARKYPLHRIHIIPRIGLDVGPVSTRRENLVNHSCRVFRLYEIILCVMYTPKRRK